LVVLVDFILFGADVVSAGVLIPVAFLAAGALGFLVFHMQRTRSGDHRKSALVKALVLAVVTAILLLLAVLLAVPGALLGIKEIMQDRPVR
jgi:hypothetical protein